MEIIENGDGGVTLSGSAIVQFGVVYIGNASANISGSAEIESDYLGLFVAESSATSTAFDISMSFNPSREVDDLPAEDTTISTECGCDGVPPRIEIASNLSSAAPLRDFLSHNSLTMGDTSSLKFSNTSSWTSTSSYSGFSVNGDGTERWTIVIEWECTSFVGGYDIGTPVWRLGILARRSVGNRSRITRLMMIFGREGSCQNGKLGFSFDYDTESGSVSTSPVIDANPSVLYDEIGMFKNPDWFDNPVFSATVREFAEPPVLLNAREGIVYPPNLTYPFN